VNRIVFALLVAAVLLPITALLGRVDVDAQQGQYRLYVPGIAMDHGELAPASTPTPAAVPPGLVACIVANVVDGDTIDVANCSDAGRVRLILVDTPEVFGGVQCYGREASEYTRSRLLGQTVQLEKDVSNTDRFGRLLRHLWTEEGLFNEQIVRDGFATLATFPPDIRYVERIRAAQQEAYDAGRGLWGEDACVEPPPAPSQPTPTATSPTQMTWYTSSHSSAQYYHCALDPQWKNLNPAYLRSYPSEAALLAVWAGTRVKFHSSKC
jgi:endonuclease YncB( thermonuclease family)